MSNKTPTFCPSCEASMNITELSCPHCNTRVQGDFAPDSLFHLSDLQRQFVEVFLRVRGNIREVEREMGISYPTVRARLDEVIRQLDGKQTDANWAPDDAGTDAIQQLKDGELTFEETLEKLRKG